MRLVMLFIAALLVGGYDPAPGMLPAYGNIPEGVAIASARSMGTRGLLWTSTNGSGACFASDLPQQPRVARTVTILVHGYNTPASKVSTYFADLMAYILQDESR